MNAINFAVSILIRFQRPKIRNHVNYTCQLVDHINSHLLDSYIQLYSIFSVGFIDSGDDIKFESEIVMHLYWR